MVEKLKSDRPSIRVSVGHLHKNNNYKRKACKLYGQPYFYQPPTYTFSPNWDRLFPWPPKW